MIKLIKSWFCIHLDKRLVEVKLEANRSIYEQSSVVSYQCNRCGKNVHSNMTFGEAKAERQRYGY
jgi:RNase P subunit RPR2